MKKSALGLMASLFLMLPACASQQSGEAPIGKVTYYPVNQEAYQERSLYDLGRIISHNSVDLYDPALLTTLLPTDDPERQNSLAKFAAHQTMVIKDEAVIVYAMASTTTTEDIVAQQWVETNDSVYIATDVGEPVPLVVDGTPLPP
jgi:hypothetical protein